MGRDWLGIIYNFRTIIKAYKREVHIANGYVRRRIFDESFNYSTSICQYNSNINMRIFH